MHLFRCDVCGDIQEQGTITGGTPKGWNLEFDPRPVQVTEGTGKKKKTVTRMMSHTLHFCGACDEQRKKSKASK